jgi:hypothetical protein
VDGHKRAEAIVAAVKLCIVTATLHVKSGKSECDCATRLGSGKRLNCGERMSDVDVSGWWK